MHPESCSTPLCPCVTARVNPPANRVNQKIIGMLHAQRGWPRVGVAADMGKGGIIREREKERTPKLITSTHPEVINIIDGGEIAACCRYSKLQSNSDVCLCWGVHVNEGLKESHAWMQMYMYVQCSQANRLMNKNRRWVGRRWIYHQCRKCYSLEFLDLVLWLSPMVLSSNTCNK